jgi:hypothetical protein
VYRFEFQNLFVWESGNSLNLIKLVAEYSIILEILDDQCQRFNWAEALDVSVSAKKYSLKMKAIEWHI